MNDINNPYLVTPIVVYLVVQILKFLVPAARGDYEIKRLWQLDGTPAAHVAAVISLIQTTIAVDGVSSPWMGAVVGLTILMLYYEFSADRRMAALSRTVRELAEKEQHPTQVKQPPANSSATWIGLAVGFLMGWLLTISHWRDDVNWLGERPTDNESQVYIYIFAGVLILAEFLVAYTRRKTNRKLPTFRKLKRAYRLSLTLPAAIGLMFALIQNQTRNQDLADRFWTTLAFVAIPLATIWAYLTVYRSAKKHLKEEAVHFQEEKRIEKKKKRNKKRRRK